MLFAGLFMGWSLGTNDAANAFGTAVATRVVKYRTSIIIIATMVVLGSILQGADDIDKLSSISTNNEVSADAADIESVGVDLELAIQVGHGSGLATLHLYRCADEGLTISGRHYCTGDNCLCPGCNCSNHAQKHQ